MLMLIYNPLTVGPVEESSQNKLKNSHIYL